MSKSQIIAQKYVGAFIFREMAFEPSASVLVLLLLESWIYGGDQLKGEAAEGNLRACRSLQWRERRIFSGGRDKEEMIYLLTYSLHGAESFLSS